MIKSCLLLLTCKSHKKPIMRGLKKVIHLQVSIHNNCIINWTATKLLPTLRNIGTQFKADMEHKNVRWAFNASTWKPSEQEILAASSYIQPEEKQRISRFIFQDDAKSSLIGRLFMRKYINLATSIPYDTIRFGRDANNKPYLLNSQILPNFNLSHQGDYTVFAGNMKKSIGIDVMKIEPPPNKNIPDFFRIMNRQFSQHEWSTIHSFPTEMQQVACFYRMWCLKESYVKNIGMGITVPLDLISFSIQNPLSVGEIVTNTKLYEKCILKHDWVFEETLLDEKHAVAVSLQIDKDADYKPVPYTFLEFKDLTIEARPLCDPDPVFTRNLLSKKVKEFKMME